MKFVGSIYHNRWSIDVSDKITIILAQDDERDEPRHNMVYRYSDPDKFCLEYVQYQNCLVLEGSKTHSTIVAIANVDNRRDSSVSMGTGME